MAHKYIPKKRNPSPLEYAEKAAGDRAWDQKKAADVKQQRSINKLGEIVKKHGKGSRRGQEAIQKFLKLHKDSALKGERKVRRAEASEDTDLIRQYGADAMQARGFGTTYPKVKRNMGGPAKKREKKSKVFSGDAYVKEVNHYKDM
tara:strand:+ start:15 stop:452 length:438 start_codon:yes stop_codon:yes gene_type:complete